jgi:hypothetical protein
MVHPQETPVRISSVLNGILMNYYIYNDLTDNNDSDIKDSSSILKIQINLDNGYNIEKNIDDDKNIECSICYIDYKPIDCVSFICNHKFCFDCTHQLIKIKHMNCPNCRNEINQINCHNNETYESLVKIINQY